MRKSILTRTVMLMMAIILLGTTAFAAAEDSVVQPRYIGISVLTKNLEITSGGRADCYCYIGLNSAAASGKLTMELQQSDDNGASWTELKTWDTSGSIKLELDESWYVVSGYQYRVHILVKTYDADDDLLEMVSKFTDPVDY